MKELWNRLHEALALADGVLRRWGVFDGLDAEEWEALHREAEADRWDRLFDVAETEDGFNVTPKTDAARVLALFVDVLDEIINAKVERT